MDPGPRRRGAATMENAPATMENAPATMENARRPWKARRVPGLGGRIGRGLDRYSLDLGMELRGNNSPFSMRDREIANAPLQRARDGRDPAGPTHATHGAVAANVAANVAAARPRGAFVLTA